MSGTGKIDEAVSVLASVKSQLTRSARADCFRAEAQICVAVLGLVGGLCQSLVIGSGTEQNFGFHFVQYWVVIAAGAALLVTADTGYRYIWFSTDRYRSITRKTLQELAPAMVTTAAVTVVITLYHRQSMPLLPGLWAIGLGLAIFATITRFGKFGIWLALFYAIAGLAALAGSKDGWEFHPVIMSSIFGVGHLVSGVMFFMDRRTENKPAAC